MMRERDIRQETFEEYKDSKPSKLVTFSALTTGVGMLAAFGFGQFSFFFGSAACFHHRDLPLHLCLPEEM